MLYVDIHKYMYWCVYMCMGVVSFSAATNLFWIRTVEAGIACISYTIPVTITLTTIANSWAVILRGK